ncbi:MAG: 2,3,4,5-tetrahydropyridine-2,6-dicarboxylate N-succinyltransferase [Candidatus Cloacimonetes bacterium]|nr:2,3,4,5-tetrahydropyridine-2,6-dicarboxylate N-succinyltransferase [Candidatus Cloacimonadota bacterium]
MKQQIESLFQTKPEQYQPSDRSLISDFLAALNTGSIRACEKPGEDWIVNTWVKMGILCAFRMGKLTQFDWGGKKPFFDKDTLPERQFSLQDQVRIVPGGTSARNGCFLAPNVAVMPPAFINVGAYVDSGSLIDSHALVGSCAQIGRNVHLSAGAMIGGVLEPIGLRPVIVEDDVFIGGNSGIYEGILIRSRAVIASGVVITSSTPVFDAVNGAFLPSGEDTPLIIPPGAVVVSGSRRLRTNPDFQIYCPIIIKYRDAKTDHSVRLERAIRELTD